MLTAGCLNLILFKEQVIRVHRLQPKISVQSNFTERDVDEV